MSKQNYVILFYYLLFLFLFDSFDQLQVAVYLRSQNIQYVFVLKNYILKYQRSIFSSRKLISKKLISKAVQFLVVYIYNWKGYGQVLIYNLLVLINIDFMNNLCRCFIFLDKSTAFYSLFWANYLFFWYILVGYNQFKSFFPSLLKHNFYRLYTWKV